MRTREVLSHYKRASKVEQAVFAETGEALLERTQDLRQTSRAIESIIRGSVGVGEALDIPRLSHLVVFNAYSDILQLRTRGKSANQALAFLEDVAIPMAGIEVKEAPAKGRLVVESLIACPAVERYFSECVHQVTTGKPGSQYRISVYHDLEGSPLVLRKSRDESSGLTLKPVSINGNSAVPAGTAVAIGRAMNACRIGQTMDNNLDLNTFLVEGDLMIMPTRLTPWAYSDPLDRSMFAVEKGWTGNLTYDRKRGQLIEGYELDDFRQVASTIMERCGVAG